jgi:hypothetical protein
MAKCRVSHSVTICVIIAVAAQGNLNQFQTSELMMECLYRNQDHQDVKMGDSRLSGLNLTSLTDSGRAERGYLLLHFNLLRSCRLFGSRCLAELYSARFRYWLGVIPGTKKKYAVFVSAHGPALTPLQ